MNLEASGWKSGSQRAAVAAGLFAGAGGVAALIGWAAGIEALKSFVPGLATMKPTTAIAFALCGASLALLGALNGSPEPYPATHGPPGQAAPAPAPTALRASAALTAAARLAALLAALIGAATLVEWLFGADLRIDTVLFGEAVRAGSAGAAAPGRMSPGTALSFVFVGSALLLIERRAAELLALAAGAVSLMVAAGYAYSLATTGHLVSYTSLSLPTGLAFLLLSVGILLARPRRGLVLALRTPGPGRTVLRRLVPAAVAIPVLLAWIAQEGESAGLYGDPVGGGVLAAGTMIALVVVIWLTARTLEASEALRAVAAQQREASEANYRGLFDSSPVGLCRTLADGTIIEANAAMARVLGYPDVATVMRVNVVALYANPDDRTRMLAEVDATGHAVTEVELRRADGALTWVQVHSRLMNPADGGAPRYERALIDISQRKRLETQFMQAQKMEAVGRLAGGIAHDFNNLLTVIRSYCDLVLQEIPATSALRSDLKEIAGAAERAASLARQLLAFSRKQVLLPQLLDPSAAVQEVVKMLGRVLPSTVHCALRAGADVGTIRADPGHIDQLLMNLSINAADAMPDGGTLTIETANATLDEAYARQHVGVRPGDYVMIAVTDTGIGMDQATLAHIFEPFFTTKPVGKGTGLGLATVYGVVEQNQGHLWVYSEVGQGTTFKVYFPRVAEEPAVRAPRTTPPEVRAAGQQRTVLVVEDDDAVRGSIVKVLEREGYQVLTAAHGGEGIRAGRERAAPIDLVISDLMMPEMGGREFVERLAKVHPESRVLLMSGYTDDDVLRRGLIDPGYAFLEKPFTVEQLVRKVTGVFEGG